MSVDLAGWYGPLEYALRNTASFRAEAIELSAALVDANELTPWLIGTEPPSRRAFRPLLPGDLGCEE